MDFLLEVFGFPVKSGSLLLAGELPLRYYSGNFALRKPSWSLPDVGGVQALLSAGGSGVGLVEFSAAGIGLTLGVAGLEELEGLGKECDLPRKRHGGPHVFHGNRWKRLRSLGDVLGSGAGSAKRGRLSLHEHGFFPREAVG